MTIRAKINELFCTYPGAKMTATRIAYETGVRRDNVASVLVRMVDRGELQRRSGYGPRGGYAYFRKKDQ